MKLPAGQSVLWKQYLEDSRCVQKNPCKACWILENNRELVQTDCGRYKRDSGSVRYTKSKVKSSEAETSIATNAENRNQWSKEQWQQVTRKNWKLQKEKMEKKNTKSNLTRKTQQKVTKNNRKKTTKGKWKCKKCQTRKRKTTNTLNTK